MCTNFLNLNVFNACFCIARKWRGILEFICVFCEIQWYPGNNVGMGKDHTIFSLIDGLVKFEKFGPEHRKKVNVFIIL
jgi:Ribosomal L27 protein